LGLIQINLMENNKKGLFTLGRLGRPNQTGPTISRLVAHQQNRGGRATTAARGERPNPVAPADEVGGGRRLEHDGVAAD
jgi:hypothetical protein